MPKGPMGSESYCYPPWVVLPGLDARPELGGGVVLKLRLVIGCLRHDVHTYTHGGSTKATHPIGENGKRVILLNTDQALYDDAGGIPRVTKVPMGTRIP